MRRYDKKLPTTDSIQELTHFWDKHDVTDFEARLEEVNEPVFEREVVMKIQLELEITERKFELFFSDKPREKMKSHIQEFKSLTTSIKK